MKFLSFRQNVTVINEHLLLRFLNSALANSSRVGSILIFNFTVIKNTSGYYKQPGYFVSSSFWIIVFNNCRNSYRYEPFAEKPGSCPPALPLQICSQSCFSDSQCLGIGKCCPTACGGFVCSRPVTMRKPDVTEKPGSCPARPTGKWVCSPTCSVDSDCRGTLKCCKNRCGALACQKPELEVVESVETPAFPPFNYMPSNPYDRNPNMYPYYYRIN